MSDAASPGSQDTKQEQLGPVAQRSRLQFVSLALAIGGAIVFWFGGGWLTDGIAFAIFIGAIVTGHLAIRENRRTHGSRGAVPVVALVIAYAHAAFAGLMVVTLVVFLGMWGSAGRG